MYLFDYKEYKAELLHGDNEETKAMIEVYMSTYGDNDLRKEPYYKDYISRFEVIPYRVPFECLDAFDYPLLAQCICSSFSSNYMFRYNKNEELPDLIVSVGGPNNSIIKKTIEELWSFQLLKLFHIYINENINYQLLMDDEENEKVAITSERNTRIKKHKLILQNLSNIGLYNQNVYNGKQIIKSILKSDNNIPF